MDEMKHPLLFCSRCGRSREKETDRAGKREHERRRDAPDGLDDEVDEADWIGVLLHLHHDVAGQDAVSHQLLQAVQRRDVDPWALGLARQPERMEVPAPPNQFMHEGERK